MFDAGSIVARITLDASAFNTSINQARQGVAKIGQDMTNLGKNIMSTTRQLSRVASALTFLGVGLTAPLVAAFKSAEKYSNSVRLEVERFGNILIKLRVSIAESLLPVMHRLSNILADLSERWQRLSPELREAILRTTLLTGIFLILGGAIASILLKIGTLIGAVIKFSGVLLSFSAAHPVILGLTILFLSLGLAIAKSGDIATPVLNAIEKSILNVHNAWLLFRRSIAWIDVKSAINAEDFTKANIELKLLNESLTANRTRLAEIAKTGKGQFAQAYEDIKTTLDLFKDLGKTEISVPKMLEASKTFGQGWKDQLDLTIKDLNDWGKMAGNIVTQMASTMQATLSDFFQRFLKGEIRSAKELFVSFGNFVLKIMSDVVAQIITAKLVAGIGGAISSLFGGVASGVSAGTGAISGSIGNVPVSGTIGGGAGIVTGFQEGTERIPYTGLYKLHSGEMITPRYDATKHEATKLTIYNMITSEAVAAAMSGREGEGVIINAINLNSLRNGVIRREVVKR